jgi:hypothetical protein
MADNPFAFAHAVFHVIVFIVVHGLRARRGIKPPSKQTGAQNRNSVMPSRLRIRTIKTVEQQLKNERRAHEARSSISKPIALS